MLDKNIAEQAPGLNPPDGPLYPLFGQLDFSRLMVGTPIIDLWRRQWLTIDQAAALLDVPRRDVGQLVADGRLFGALKMRVYGGRKRWWIPFPPQQLF